MNEKQTITTKRYKKNEMFFNGASRMYRTWDRDREREEKQQNISSLFVIYQSSARKHWTNKRTARRTRLEEDVFTLWQIRIWDKILATSRARRGCTEWDMVEARTKTLPKLLTLTRIVCQKWKEKERQWKSGRLKFTGSFICGWKETGNMSVVLCVCVNDVSERYKYK